MTTNHSPAPFFAVYEPYRSQRGREIPCFRIYDAESKVIAETESAVPHRQQEADARVMTAGPELLEALDAQTTAAQAVIDNWSKGDLAAAVNALEATIDKAKAAITRAKGGATE